MYGARVVGMPKIWGKKSNHPSKPKKRLKIANILIIKEKRKIDISQSSF